MEEETDLLKKRQIYITAIIESDKLSIIENFDEQDKQMHLTFNAKCKKAIEIIDFQLQHMPKQIAEEENNKLNQGTLKLASNKKTDFIKIISALYDARMFETEKGYIASNKQVVMDEFGKLLGENFKSYSTILSQSKNAELNSFLKPFKELEKRAKDYYEKENK